MDIAREHTTKGRFSLEMVIKAGLGMVILVFAVYSLPKLTNKSISRHALLVGEVKKGSMQVEVYGNGVLVPREVRWVAANVSGRVSRILVKPGNLAEKGQILVELDNPEMLQNAEEAYWDVEASRAELTALDVALESDVLNQRSRIQTVEIDLESAQIRFEAEATLIEADQSSISLIEHKNSQLKVRKLNNELAAEKFRLSRLIKNRDAKLNAERARLKKLENTLQRAQSQVDYLSVFARETGIVQEVSIELGQQLSVGSNIVKIADQSDLVAEIKVDQRRINEVALGQMVVIDTTKRKVQGKVARIDPAVVNGAVLVEVEFSEALPPEARPDLRISGDVLVADIQDTYYVKRPVLAQSDQQAVIFKLDDAEHYANKVRVTYGQGSLDKIQILAGLSLGDKIILSDHSGWEHLNKVRIN